MLVEGIKIIRIYNDKSKPDEVFYRDLRPATRSMEEHLEPAARYLLSLIRAAEKAEMEERIKARMREIKQEFAKKETKEEDS